MSGHTYICGPQAPCREHKINYNPAHYGRVEPTFCWHASTARRMAWVYGDDAQALDAATDRMNGEARRWNDGAAA